MVTRGSSSGGAGSLSPQPGRINFSRDSYPLIVIMMMREGVELPCRRIGKNLEGGNVTFLFTGR